MNIKKESFMLFCRITALFYTLLLSVILGCYLAYPQIVISLRMYLILIVVAVPIIIGLYLLYGLRHKSSVLDFSDARRIVLLCQKPKTTRFLRAKYQVWNKQTSEDVEERKTFDDCIQKLEKEGFLEYTDGKWHLKKKALEAIANKLLYGLDIWDT